MTSADHRFNRVAVLATALLAAGLASRANAAEFAKSYPVTSRPDVRIKTDDGNVHVVTSETSQVEFRVTYEGYTIDKNLFITSAQDGARVELAARVKSALIIGVNTRRLSIEVRMPKNSDLRLETGDGDVDVASVNGTVSVVTGDGRVKVARLSGTLDLRTGDGGVTADALKGDVKLRTGDGTVDASNLDGKFDVSSGDGAIRLTGRFDALDLKSGDGRIVVRAATGSQMGSSWNIRTGDGPVELELPRDFKANVDATTNDGHIKLGVPMTVEGELSETKVRGSLNGGGPPLRIHSGDGSITISGSPGPERT